MDKFQPGDKVKVKRPHVRWVSRLMEDVNLTGMKGKVSDIGISGIAIDFDGLTLGFTFKDCEKYLEKIND